jgi:O-antigen/teichoic acid export membrane protein
LKVFRNLVKDSAIYGGADFFSKVIAFFTFPLIAAALSPRAFGALELIGTTTALLGLAMNCGLNNSVQRYYWDKDTAEKQRPVIVSSGLAAQILFGIITTIVGFLILPIIYPEVQKAQLPLTWIALVAAVLLMVFSQWNQYALDVMRLHFAPWRFFVLSMLSRGFSAVAGLLVVVVYGWGVDGLLVAQAFVVAAVLPLAIFLIRKDITLGIDYTWTRELVGFGYPFIFAGIAYWLFGSIDRWMLASMSSVEEVGIYSVAFRFATVVVFVSAAFGQAWSPVAIKIRTDNPENYRTIYANVLLLLLFVMFLIGGGLSLFSGEIIYLIMPASYADSAVPLAILCFGIVFQATQQVTAVGISLEKKTFLFARLAWLTALVNIIGNLLLIPLYGATGAAIATLISFLVLTSSYLYFTQRLHPLPISKRRLAWLLFLGALVFAVSVYWNDVGFTWNVLSLKLAFAACCIFMAFPALPVITKKGFGRKN